ncbi:MAG: hypothetical protein RQ760_15950, partial [Sedimentisphaerales bacterium]|nr:hypothetical protein [Sedimentisphaerales bacterium]
SFGQRLKFGLLGGNLCLWGPERFFSVVRNADCTYAFPGRAVFSELPASSIQHRELFTRNPH